ncbi:unnamed protein product, partial [Oppiella nova]
MKGHCQHNCSVVGEGGYICVCPRGYQIQLNDTKLCEDINECSGFGHNCSQTCVNIEGTYTCKCKQGFEMIDERCVVKSEVPAFVLYTDGPDIRAVDLSQQHQSSLVAGESRVQSLDFDPITDILYWTDTYDKTIKRAVIPNPSDPEHGNGFSQNLDLKGLTKPVDIAVDWVGRNLYWMDMDLSNSKPKGRIFASLLDGRYRKAVV